MIFISLPSQTKRIYSIQIIATLTISILFILYSIPIIANEHYETASSVTFLPGEYKDRICYSVKELNGTAVEVLCRNLSTYDFSYPVTGHNSHNYKLRISYKLAFVLLEVLHVESSQAACADSALRHSSKNYTLDIEVCKGRINKFGSYNDSQKNYDYLFVHCEYPKHVFIDLPTPNNSIIINDLLPHQPYKFNYSVVFPSADGKWISVEERTLGAVCMADSAPLYTPQTDLGSFKIDEPPKDMKKMRIFQVARKVDLYWRPIPKLFATSGQINYILNCTDMQGKLFYSNCFSDIFTGYTRVELFANVSYKCYLRTSNHLGTSLNSSLIEIPSQDRIIDTQGKFNAYVTAITNSEYVMSWSDMGELLKEQESAKGLRGYQPPSPIYTVYWCLISSQSRGCAYIEGMVKTKHTNIAIDIPGDGMPQNRIFGVSYRSEDNKNYTGIIWSDCVATVRSQAQSAYDPLEIVKAHGVRNNHTSINLSWTFRGCKSLIALIGFYEINYCNIGRVDPCAVTTSQSEEILESEIQFDGNPNCTTIQVRNKLLTEIILENLNASTKYAIRIRHSTRVYNVSNVWSETAVADTSADSRGIGECLARQRSVLFLIVLFVVTFIALAIVYFPIKRMFLHYWSLLFRYRQTNTGIPQRIEEKRGKGDNLSEIGLKYWINRFPTPDGGSPANSESSLNIYGLDAKTGRITRTRIDHEDRENNGENYDNDNYVQQQIYISDYIPTQLLTNQADRYTQDSTTESTRDKMKDSLSDTDDISVTSHSSFLENILNDETDSNNNFNSINAQD